MADAEDPEFWTHINLNPIHLIMFAMPNYLDIMEAAKQIRMAGIKEKQLGLLGMMTRRKK